MTKPWCRRRSGTDVRRRRSRRRRPRRRSGRRRGGGCRRPAARSGRPSPAGWMRRTSPGVGERAEHVVDRLVRHGGSSVRTAASTLPVSACGCRRTARSTARRGRVTRRSAPRSRCSKSASVVSLSIGHHPAGLFLNESRMLAAALWQRYPARSNHRPRCVERSMASLGPETDRSTSEERNVSTSPDIPPHPPLEADVPVQDGLRPGARSPHRASSGRPPASCWRSSPSPSSCRAPR